MEMLGALRSARSVCIHTVYAYFVYAPSHMKMAAPIAIEPEWIVNGGLLARVYKCLIRLFDLDG